MAHKKAGGSSRNGRDSDGRRLGAASEAERREVVSGNFARMFGERAARPSGYLERNWSAEPYSRGWVSLFWRAV